MCTENEVSQHKEDNGKLGKLGKPKLVVGQSPHLAFGEIVGGRREKCFGWACCGCGVEGVFELSFICEKERDSVIQDKILRDI